MAIDFFGGAGIFSIAFVLLFIAATLGIAAVFAFMVYAVARNASKVSRLGHDPITLQSDLAVKALDSALLAESKSTEARLRETDDLLARKVITADEHAAARAAILAS